MSYDFEMEMDAGGEEPMRAGDTWRNYTSNVSPMWAEALGFPIKELDGKQGEHCAPLLEAAAERMQSDPETYSAMNPENGWGNYEGAMDVLRELASHCRTYPKAQLSVRN